MITVGTEGDPFARVSLMTVFGCGLRLSEATNVQVSDIDGPRLQPRISHPKGGRQRVTIVSPFLRPRACNPLSPHEMGRVERAVGYVKAHFLTGRTLGSLDACRRLRENRVKLTV